VTWVSLRLIFKASCANISTTQAYYIFPNQTKAKAGLKKLTETVRKKYDIKA
jgi:hypothetical protein